MSPITGGSGEHRPGGGGLSHAGMPLPASLVPWARRGSLGRDPWEVLQPKGRSAQSGLLLSVLTSTTQAPGHPGARGASRSPTGTVPTRTVASPAARCLVVEPGVGTAGAPGQAGGDPQDPVVGRLRLRGPPEGAGAASGRPRLSWLLPLSLGRWPASLKQWAGAS